MVSGSALAGITYLLRTLKARPETTWETVLSDPILLRIVNKFNKSFLSTQRELSLSALQAAPRSRIEIQENWESEGQEKFNSNTELQQLWTQRDWWTWFAHRIATDTRFAAFKDTDTNNTVETRVGLALELGLRVLSDIAGLGKKTDEESKLSGDNLHSLVTLGLRDITKRQQPKQSSSEGTPRNRGGVYADHVEKHEKLKSKKPKQPTPMSVEQLREDSRQDKTAPASLWNLAIKAYDRSRSDSTLQGHSMDDDRTTRGVPEENNKASETLEPGGPESIRDASCSLSSLDDAAPKDRRNSPTPRDGCADKTAQTPKMMRFTSGVYGQTATRRTRRTLNSGDDWAYGPLFHVDESGQHVGSDGLPQDPVVETLHLRVPKPGFDLSATWEMPPIPDYTTMDFPEPPKEFTLPIRATRRRVGELKESRDGHRGAYLRVENLDELLDDPELSEHEIEFQYTDRNGEEIGEDDFHKQNDDLDISASTLEPIMRKDISALRHSIHDHNAKNKAAWESAQKFNKDTDVESDPPRAPLSNVRKRKLTSNREASEEQGPLKRTKTTMTKGAKPSKKGQSGVANNGNQPAGVLKSSEGRLFPNLPMVSTNEHHASDLGLHPSPRDVLSQSTTTASFQDNAPGIVRQLDSTINKGFAGIREEMAASEERTRVQLQSIDGKLDELIRLAKNYFGKQPGSSKE